MEIIASKYERKATFVVLLILCVVMALVGAALVVASGYIVNYPEALTVWGFVQTITFLILGAAMVYSLVRFIRLPQDLITYENGVFAFPYGKSCRAEEITDVSYNSVNPGYRSVSYDFGFGQIKLRIGSQKITVKYVENPSGVANRIRELVREAKFSASSQINH